MAVEGEPLTAEELARMDVHWPAANYLSVGQIYLIGNPLLHDELPVPPTSSAATGADDQGLRHRPNIVYTHLSRRHREPWPQVIHLAVPVTAGPVWWPTRGSTGRTARSIRDLP